MCLGFDELENNAKIFLYPSNKKLHESLFKEINLKAQHFVKNWREKHNIEANYTIKYQRFIIIAIHPNKPITTAIIDELIGFIFSLQLEYDLELLDKLNVCFKQGEYVQYKDVKEFKKLIKNKSVTPKTIVFNNLINTKEELETDWELPAEDTWYSRMF